MLKKIEPAMRALFLYGHFLSRHATWRTGNWHSSAFNGDARKISTHLMKSVFADQLFHIAEHIPHGHFQGHLGADGSSLS